jgi:hypothetical protein
MNVFQINLIILYFYMFIFFTCIKKTNQKKVQPVTWSRLLRDCPALLAKNGRHRKVVSLRRVAYPFLAVLLGCVRWQKN